MIVFPAIDLIAGKVVRLSRGDRSKMDVYSDDPVAVAQDFVRRGASWIHVVDLSATFEDALHAGEVRIDDPVILAVDSRKCAEAGYPIGKAAKTVYLCDMVPADCITVSEGDEESEE